MQTMAAANMDFVKIGGLQCVVKLNFYDTLKTAIAFPVIIVAALILLLQLGR
jgi:hypothetical protein